MRTYTRKKLGDLLLEGVDGLCRLCLNKVVDGWPIFFDDCNGFQAGLALRIMMCVGLEMTDEEHLPKTICQNCHMELQRCYTFRKKCQASYQKLKSHVEAVRIKLCHESRHKPIEQPEITDETDKTNEIKDGNNIEMIDGSENLVNLDSAPHFLFTVDLDGTVNWYEGTKNFKKENSTEKITQISDQEQLNTDTIQVTDQNSFMLDQQNMESNINNKEISTQNETIDVVETCKTERNETEANQIIVDTPKSINLCNTNHSSILKQNNVATRKSTVSNKLIILNNNETSNTSESKQNIIVIDSLENKSIVQKNKTLNGQNVAKNGKKPLINTNSVLLANFKLNEDLPSETSNTKLVDNKLSEGSSGLVSINNCGAVIQHKIQLNHPSPTSIQIESSTDDLPAVFSAMLVEFGVLEQQAGGLQLMQDQVCVEMETGDEQQVILELVEVCEDEEMESTTATPAMQENKANSRKRKDVDIHSKNGPSPDVPWCFKCNKPFASTSAVSRHVRDVHERHKPHACRVCWRRFAQKDVCLRHELVHDERRPFQCRQCPKGFTQRHALELHERSHAPPQARPLTLHCCYHCPKQFLYASGLSRHMWQHKGAVFECSECQRHFSDKSSLRRHLNNTRHKQADQS